VGRAALEALLLLRVVRRVLHEGADVRVPHHRLLGGAGTATGSASATEETTVGYADIRSFMMNVPYNAEEQKSGEDCATHEEDDPCRRRTSRSHLRQLVV